QVVQYTKGRGIDNNPTADPEALYIFPPTMWQNSYFFYPIYTPTAQNLEITVVVEDIGSPLPSTTILLNGNNIGGGNWVSIPNTNFKYKRISDPEFISSRIESSSGARFGFFFFARNERETAFFSGGYGPLTEVSLCEQCAEADILTEGSFCVNSTIDFNPAIYSFTTPQNLQYSWNFGDGFTSTERSPSHAFNRFGNFPVQLSISDGSCVISTSRFVQVNDISIDATPADSLICLGDSATLNSTPTLQPSDEVTVRYLNDTPQEIADITIGTNWPGVGGNPTQSSITINDNFILGWKLDSICFNIKHSKIGDVAASIQSPCGNVFVLTRDGSTAGRANYRKTCFSPTAFLPVNAAIAPFTGDYIPVSGAGIWPTLQSCNPKGTWTLRVGDDSVLVGGTLVDWSLYFTTPNAINNLAWSPNQDITSTTNPSTTVFPASDRNYVLQVSDFNACSARDTVKIRVTRQPVEISGGDTVLCSTDSVINLFTLLPDSVSRTGFWADESGSGRLIDSLFFPNQNTIGLFAFKYRIPVYCGFDSAIVRVRVNKLPALGSSAADTVCNTIASLDLFRTLGGNPDSGGEFASTNLGGGQISGDNFLTSNAAEGDYFIYYKKPTEGCVVDSTLLKITVFRQRNPGLGYDTTLCERKDLIDLFNLLKSNPDQGGQWIDVNNTGAMTPDGKWNTLGLNNGTYVFRYRFSGNQPCRDTTATLRITLRVAPEADITTPFPKLCKDSTATIQVALSGNGPFDLLLKSGNDTMAYNATNGPIIFTPTITTQTIIKVVSLVDRTALRCPVIFPDSLIVTVFPPVEATLIKEECALDLTVFRAIVTLEGGDNATYMANGVPFAGNTYFSPPIPNGTTYTITFNDATNCSSSIITDRKYCECISEAAILNTTLKQYCAPDIATATQVIPPVVEPEDTVVWVLHDRSGITLGNVLERRSDSSFVFNVNNPDYIYGKTYYISQVVGNAGDSLGFDRLDTCIDVSRGTPVRWNALPTAAIDGDATICVGTSTPLTIQATGRAPFVLNVSVNGQDTSYALNALTTVLSVSPFDSTTYLLRSITDGNTPVCSSLLNDSARIRVNQLPTAAISGNAVICE
ncbi:MAG TPA: PKD domain-containing protein, partial [Luteibaculaceae bacterium]|nr:PKD domain-containing protein [Luteibaculaceae bacterium]